jgi:hypothetical protein
VSSTPQPVGFESGIITVGCKVTSGRERIVVGSYDPATKSQSHSVTYLWPSGDRNSVSVGRCSGAMVRSGFNDDYTRLFVSRKDPETRTEVVGYLTPGGSFTQLSKKAGEFRAVDDTSPSFHTGTGRLYYMDEAGASKRLRSMTVDGKDVRDETSLLDTYDVRSKPVMVDAERPIVAQVDDRKLYSESGKTAAFFSSRNNSRGLAYITLQNEGEREYQLDQEEFAASSWSFGGFIGEASLVFTDSQQIYRVDFSGNTGKVTTLLSNTNPATEVKSVAVSGQKDKIAFISGSGSDDNYLYSLSLSGGEPDKVAHLPYRAQIAEFRG